MDILPNVKSVMTNSNSHNTTNYKSIYLKNIPQQPIKPITINLPSSQRKAWIIDNFYPCEHIWESVVSEINVFRKCNICKNTRMFEDLRYKSYKKIRK